MPRRPKSQWLGRAPAEAGAPRTPPPAPDGLGEAGRAAWDFVFRQYWISPDRHRLLVERYCMLRDLLADAHAELRRGGPGLMVLGSHKQVKFHPAMVEIRQLSAELRALEVELALTPSSASKAGVPLGDPGPTLADLDRMAEEAAAEDDPRDPLGLLRVIEGGGAS